MSKFSSFLKTILDERGEPIAQIARNSGLERTSIHKALKDERILSYTALKKLTAYLQLPLAEIRELNQYYEILLLGEDTFQTQQAICDLLFELYQIRYISDEYVPHQNVLQKLPDFPKLVSGKARVDRTLRLLLQWESSRENAEFYLYLPGEDTVCNWLRYFWMDGHKFKVHQLVAFLPDNGNGDRSSANMRSLAQILPTALLSRSQYDAYLYYDQLTANVNIHPMPYFIITPNFVISLDEKHNRAQLQTEPEIIAAYREHFEQISRESQELVSYSSDFASVIDAYMNNTGSDGYYTLMPQPCMARYCTRQRITEHIRQGLLHREELIEMADKRCAKLRNLTGNYYSFFSESGLAYFAETGIIIDFPQEVVRSLTPKVRLDLLYEMKKDIEDDIVTGRIVNEEKLSLPSALTLTCDPDYGLHIYALPGYIDGAYTCNLHILNSGIGQAFCRFIKALPNTMMLYTKEQTLDVLSRYIYQLEQLTTQEEEL